MLVLKRKMLERIMVGNNMIITVTEIGRGYVRIGIECPKSVAINREELMTQDEVRRIEQAANARTR